jgi:hypothetical protein
MVAWLPGFGVKVAHLTTSVAYVVPGQAWATEANQMLRISIERGFSSESGLSLLELMFAAGVLVMGFVLVFGAVFSISEANDVTEDRATAIAQLASVMEEIRRASYSELLEYDPPAPQGLDEDATFEVKCFDGEGAPMDLPVAADSMPGALPNPCEIQVTVTWHDRRGRTLASTSSALYRR